VTQAPPGSRLPDWGYIWDVARFTIRDLFEFVASVYLVGILPVVMHLGVTLENPSSSKDRTWVPAELYLFVMVTSAAAALETFRNRSDDGPLRSFIGIGGGIMVLVSAAGYGSLIVNSPTAQPLNDIFRGALVPSIIVMSVVYGWYRGLKILNDAMAEASLKAKVRLKRKRR
jgi:hypothetical protein